MIEAPHPGDVFIGQLDRRHHPLNLSGRGEGIPRTEEVGVPAQSFLDLAGTSVVAAGGLSRQAQSDLPVRRRHEKG
jgi:hypothetical protein